jgi:integrase
MVRSSGLIPKNGDSVPFIALLPDVEERPGYSKKTAGLTDIAAHALRMLQHAQSSLHLPSLNLLVRCVLHPKGNPLMQSNVLRRDLHPILAELGVKKAGFHTFRRFRATFLSKSRVPEALVKFSLGHANKSVTDEYIKMFNEGRFRKDVAD